jgi:tetratricopeptide (TPR) repeat protein
MFGQTSRSKKSSQRPIQFEASGKWKLPKRPLTLWITDAILATLVLVFPFIMGGREAWGHRILITLSLVLGFVWCLHRVRTGGRFRLLAIEPLLAAGLVLVWFQTVPLTPEVLGRLSGEYQRLLPHWSETQVTATEMDSSQEVAHRDEGSQPVWSTASLIPSETKHAFWMLLAYGIIGLVVSQRLETEEDCHTLLKLLGLSGVLMAGFAVLQFVTSNDKFFWIYRQPYTGTRDILKGAFTNRNHFAQFLALSLGPLLWWMMAGRTSVDTTVRHRKGLGPAQGNHSRFDNLIDPVRLLLICAAGGVLLAILMSLSRGGMIASAVVLIVCLGGLWKSGRVQSSLAFVMLGLGVIAVGGLLVFGNEKVEDRVGQLASADADRIDPGNARRALWKADLDAIKAFPLLGTGVGSHRHVYSIYMEELGEFPGVSFSHAESSYVHLATETGLAGLGLMGLGLLFVIVRLLWHLLRRSESQRVAALGAVLAGLAGGVAHAAVDFIWYVPAIVVATLMLCIIGLRLCSGFRTDSGLWMPRIAWLAVGIMCLLAAGRVQPALTQRIAGERLWYQMLIATFDEIKTHRERPGNENNLDDLNASAAGEVDPDDLAANESENSEERASEAASYNASTQTSDKHIRSLRKRISLLMASLKADPAQPRAALLLAHQCLELFDLQQQQSENPYTVKDLRDIVRDQKFDSITQMHDFLKRAFGNSVRLLLLSDQLCRRSLAMCPLQGDGYEILATTAFVRDPQDRMHHDMIEQTLLLGQHSPATRFSVGKILFRDGQRDPALEQWRVAFHQKKEARLEICAILARMHSVDVIFNEFQPTVEQLREVLTAFLPVQRPADIEKILNAVLDQTQNTAQALATTDANLNQSTGRENHLMLLMESYRAAYQMQLLDRCEALLQRAIECDPLAESPRRALALLLMQDLNRYEEAAEHLVWCYEQAPGDAKLEELLRDCRRRITQDATRTLRTATFESTPAAQNRLVRPVSHRRDDEDRF